MAYDKVLGEHPLPPSMVKQDGLVAAKMAVDDEADAEEDARLEQGLKETFPASDPVSAKHIT